MTALGQKDLAVIGVSDNEATDKRAKMASSGQHPPPDVFHEVLIAPSVAQGAAPGLQDGARSVLLVAEADWRGIIIKYLAGEEPEDDDEAKHLRHRARNYHVIGGNLYKGGVCAPNLRCLSREEVQSLLKEIHEGLCGALQPPQTIMGKAFRQGFYWPTALRDVQDLVQSCQGCQWASR